MSVLKDVPVKLIRPNPFRQLERYPLSEEKIAALTASASAVGLFEGVIGREMPDGSVQIAFGHHRVETARRTGLKTVRIIIRKLTDEQMLQLLARENMEEFNADFPALYEVYERAEDWLRGQNRGHAPAVIDVARFLGWTRPRANRAGGEDPSQAAKACSAAKGLIDDGVIDISDLDGLPLSAAVNLVGRAFARVKQISATGHSAAAKRVAKAQVGKALKGVARQTRDGKIAVDSVATAVDVAAFNAAKKSNRRTPLFAAFADGLVKSIDKTFHDDGIAERLLEITEAIPNLTMEADRVALRRIQTALADAENRISRWRKNLSSNGGKVVPMKQLSAK
jgi:hypothetical protein